VVERGAGRPLVLLHGITLSALTWHYQVDDLADRFRVIVLDQRGHGQSGQGDDDTTVERLAADLAAVLDTLDLHDAVLVGHSMGGMVTMQLLCQSSDVVDARVAGVVLVATAAGGIAPAFAGAVARTTTPVTRRGATWLARRQGSWMPANDLSWALTRLTLGKGAAPSHVELTRTMVAATPYDVVSDLTLSLLGFDVRDRLGGASVPALIIVGSHDVLTPVRQAKAIARALPHADLIVLPGCGHMVMLERRAELDEAIGDFADKLP
jgi:pimeloyl-ACP methyl ester carboxylesterase